MDSVRRASSTTNRALNPLPSHTSPNSMLGKSLPSAQLRNNFMHFQHDFGSSTTPFHDHPPILADRSQEIASLFAGEACAITPPPTAMDIASLRATQPRTGSMPLLTPPEDLEAWKWNVEPTSHAGLASADITLAIPSAPSIAEPSPNPVLDAESSGDKNRFKHTTNPDDEGTSRQGIGADSASRKGSRSQTWLEDFVRANVNLDADGPATGALQIVSQTLPRPGRDDSTLNALFVNVIAAVQSQCGPSRQPYITITHAVPPHFDLLNLPSSPPSTPNPPTTNQEDYFSPSIFAHAAVVSPQHMVGKVASPLPVSPNPIVPPSSVQISVLERYIPPFSERECRELCSLDGQSPLVDRLAELSPHDGTLLLVYPTRTGGNAFVDQYLNPILTRLLRSLVTMHQLSYHLAKSLNHMSAVPEMLEFDELKDSISNLCDRMSEQVQWHGRQSRFRLVYFDKGDVALSRHMWTDWYLKQEHGRFKRTLDEYWGRGKMLSQVEAATPGGLLRQFTDGIQDMKPDEAEAVGSGVEVGVFAIRRTLTTSPR